MYQPGPPPPPPAFAPLPYPQPRRSVPVLVPHLIWEAVLLLLVVAVCTVAVAQTPLFGGSGIWGPLAMNGLLASALALSLRTATPNLAVVGLAGLAGVVYAELVTGADLPWVIAAAVAMIAVLLVGGVFGLVAGLTSAPAWAVSLAGLAIAQAITFGIADGRSIRVPADFRLGGIGWFVIFVLISLAGGALFAIPPVRRLLSANRTAPDQVRFTGGRLVGALVGFIGSSAVAGLAGLAMVNQFGTFDQGIANNGGWLLTALAVVLLGGVSAFGGRGGVAGTVLATMLVTVTISWLSLEGLFGFWGRLVVIGLAILVGVGVSRGMEAIAPVAPGDAPLVPVGPPGAPGGPPPGGAMVMAGAPPSPPTVPAGAPPPEPPADRVDPDSEPVGGDARPAPPSTEDRDS